jgi:hypothetical protein
MYAMEHLEGVQGRRGLVAPPERSVLISVDMKIEVFGTFVHHALEEVREGGRERERERERSHL